MGKQMPVHHWIGPAIALVPLCLGIGPAAANDFALTCFGVHYRHGQPFPIKETLSMTSTDGQISVRLPDVKNPVDANTTADNDTSVISRANDMSFQYFKHTGQLFLRHDDGRITRFACKPNS